MFCYLRRSQSDRIYQNVKCLGESQASWEDYFVHQKFQICQNTVSDCKHISRIIIGDISVIAFTNWHYHSETPFICSVAIMLLSLSLTDLTGKCVTGCYYDISKVKDML